MTTRLQNGASDSTAGAAFGTFKDIHIHISSSSSSSRERQKSTPVMNPSTSPFSTSLSIRPASPTRSTSIWTSRQEIICIWADLGPCPAFDHAIKLKDLRGTMRELFEIIYLEFTGNRALADDVIASCLKTLFLLIRQGCREPSQENDSQVERCLSYIHEHFTGDFGIETLAQTISVSSSYLFRIFKRKMRVTPMHYRNLVRIDKAKLLLLDRRFTVEEIAEHVGFDGARYFSRVFKKETGLSPSEFRKKQLAG